MSEMYMKHLNITFITTFESFIFSISKNKELKPMKRNKEEIKKQIKHKKGNEKI